MTNKLTQGVRHLTPEPKASRIRVWQAADRILRSGRRPTVEGVRELLGGGSPNSVTAYINDWYRDLGSRLAAAETPLAGFPAEAVSMMTELWRLAATDHTNAPDNSSADDTATRMFKAERDSLEAEAKALQVLNEELQRHRAAAEKFLAETRALLARREAALEEERSRAATLEQALAQTRLELEIALERQRLMPARLPAASRRAIHRLPLRRRKLPVTQPPKKGRATGRKRPVAKKSIPTRIVKMPRTHGKFPTRRKG
jgi:hypothetical protein